jgi:signal transduction histidine kinase
MSRRLLIALVLAASLGVGAASALVLFAHDFQPSGGPSDALGHIALDALWIATGLVAWQRRPGNRVGLLMVAAGFADLSGQLYWNAPLPYVFFTALSSLQIPIFVHLFLAFPSGRLATRFERRFVGFVYGAWLVLAPLSQLFRDTRVEPDNCPRCPTNPLLVVHSEAVVGVLQRVVDVLVLGVLAITVVLLVQKVRAARGATRRALGPVVLTSAIAIFLLIPAGILDTIGTGDELTPLLEEAGGLAFLAIPVAFLVGLLRTKLQRAGVAGLVVELGAIQRPDDIRDALARALADPSLEVAFWLPADQRYVDPRGSPLDVTTRRGRAVTVLEHDGRRVAALVHDPALEDEPELLEAVGAAANLALENARLQAELSAQLAEVRASRARIVEAGDAERRRLERDLHDGAQQRLLGIRLALQLARGRIATGDGSVDELLTEADAEVGGALEELRALARGIHPAILTDEGLVPAIAALARRAPVPIELSIAPERLPEPVEATAYFVASEGLANIAKHARASRATIALARTNGRVAIEVTDDGVGGADAEGTGLRGLRDRVEALDGRLEVETQIGGGTRVRAVIPCA